MRECDERIRGTERSHVGRSRPRPESLDDAIRFNAWLAWAVASDKVSAQQAAAISKALDGFRSGLNERDVANEVKRLSATVTELKRRDPR